MAERHELITRAKKRDFAAVDALSAEGPDALEDILTAMAEAKGSTIDTLGDAVARMSVEPGAAVSRFLSPDISLEAFMTAVDVLARTGDAGGELRKFVETTPEDFETHRGVAIRGIARTRAANAAQFIRKIAIDADKAGQPLLLADCIEALDIAGDHSFDERAADLLRGRDVEVKLRAAALLPYLFFPALYELLDAASNQRNEEIRLKAVDALYYLGTKMAAEALLKMARGRSPNVKEEATASVAMIAGESEKLSDAASLVAKLSDDTCYRIGEPIDFAKLAERATQPNLRYDLAEELRIETGHDFAFNPSRPDSDPELVERIRSWLAANGSRFQRGGCYKFGFQQDLSSLVK